MEIKRSHILVAILLTGSMVMAATLTAGQAHYKTSTAADKADGDTAADAQKWEYCSVTKAAYTATNRSGQYWITYFKSSGFHVVNIEDNATSNAALAKAIGQLGDEGWELVAVGPLEVRAGAKLDAFYFKRPRQQH